MIAAAESAPALMGPIMQFGEAAFSMLRENGRAPVVIPLAPDDGGQDQLLRPERLGGLIAQRTGAVMLVMTVECAILRELGGDASLYGLTELAQWLADRPRSVAAPMFARRSTRWRTACRTSTWPISGSTSRWSSRC
ncbi:hypothetical protein [Burkholderia ubonensis]|uniref:hypothetical protein n=1 Tax=Burkholderia ubonensis TaxID=101571 RepID=UPI00211CD2E3|nr:hypothetical protein [Burkholderia ubonensis]